MFTPMPIAGAIKTATNGCQTVNRDTARNLSERPSKLIGCNREVVGDRHVFRILPGPVHGIGCRQIGDADVTVADGELAFSLLFAKKRDAAEIERGCEARPVSTGLANG